MQTKVQWNYHLVCVVLWCICSWLPPPPSIAAAVGLRTCEYLILGHVQFLLHLDLHLMQITFVRVPCAC